jgi:hypothetical protein
MHFALTGQGRPEAGAGEGQVSGKLAAVTGQSSAAAISDALRAVTSNQ